MVEINGTPFEYGGNDTFAYHLFKALVRDAGFNLKSAIDKFNIDHPEQRTTPQNISNKLSRDSIKLTEFIKFAESFGYKISFQQINSADAETEATPAKSAPHRIPKEKDPEEDKPVRAEHKIPRNKPAEKDVKVSYASLLARGYAVCKSINFQGIMIAGKKAEEAAAWIESKINPEMDEMEEMVVIVNANHQFQVLAKPLDGIDEQFSLFAEY